LHVPSSGGLTVSRDLAHIPFITVDDGGFIDVHHDLVNVKHAGIAFGSTIEVGHRLGETSFVFGISGGNLILDHPSHGALGNPFALGFDAVKIELGHLDFDAAVFIPNASSGLTGKIDLTEHGKLVYQLTEVSKSASGGVFSVGVDKSTGYNYVSYHG
jgi:hypothetical protein